MKAKEITPIFWASTSKVEKGKLICLKRHQGEFTLDLECGGYSYQVVARRRKRGTTYIGRWTWRDKKNSIEGDVIFDFLMTEDGFLAFGKWEEDGEYQWWFRLPSTGVASHLSSDDTIVHLGDGMDWHGWSTESKRYLDY